MKTFNELVIDQCKAKTVTGTWEENLATISDAHEAVAYYMTMPDRLAQKIALVDLGAELKNTYVDRALHDNRNYEDVVDAAVSTLIANRRYEIANTNEARGRLFVKHSRFANNFILATGNMKLHLIEYAAMCSRIYDDLGLASVEETVEKQVESPVKESVKETTEDPSKKDDAKSTKGKTK